MQNYSYETATGERADKRMWSIGTPVTVSLQGGATLKGFTSSVPLKFPSGGWGVRVKGVAFVVSLERCTVRYQRDLLATDPEETSPRDKDPSLPDEPLPCG